MLNNFLRKTARIHGPITLEETCEIDSIVKEKI
jgi:hypothetical protein